MPLQQGFKISDLELIPTAKNTDSPWKNKILLEDAYLLSYANTIRGLRYNKLNYQIPLADIRDDIRGYIGIETLNAPWTDQMFLWHGYWECKSDEGKSYVKVWEDSEKHDTRYSPKKFKDLENTYYIISEAPFPYEIDNQNNRGERGEIPTIIDKDGNSSKINKELSPADPTEGEAKQLVLKSYVDDRLASKRLVEVKENFYIRDYDCSYLIRSEQFTDTDDGSAITITLDKSVKDRLSHNTLQFNLLIEGKYDNTKNVWGAPITNDKNIVLNYVNDDEPPRLIDLPLEWLSTKPNLSEDALWDNSRYVFITFKLIAHYDTSVVNDADNVDYAAYAYCDNSIYKGDIPDTFSVNGVSIVGGNNIQITSSDTNLLVIEAAKTDETGDTLQGAEIMLNVKKLQSLSDYIKVETNTDGPTITLNKLPLTETIIEAAEDSHIIITEKSATDDAKNELNRTKRTYTIDINKNLLVTGNSSKELHDLASGEYVINLEEAKDLCNYCLASDSNRVITLKLDKNELSKYEIKNTFDFFLYVKVNPSSGDLASSQPLQLLSDNGNITWSMNEQGVLKTELNLARNKVYCIKFTYIPKVNNVFENNMLVGKIEWFYNIV